MTSARHSIASPDAEPASTRALDRLEREYRRRLRRLRDDRAIRSIQADDIRLGQHVRAVGGEKHPLGEALRQLEQGTRTSARALQAVERLAAELDRVRALPLETELRELVQASRVSRVQPVLRYLGWDGRGGSTLQAAADEVGVTRERVRQLASKVERLTGPRTFTPTLDRALAQLRRPLASVDHIERAWRASGTTETAFMAEGVLQAAQLLGRPVRTHIAVLGAERVVLDRRTARLIERARALADKTCARWTVMSVLDLEARLRSEGLAGEVDARRVVSGLEGFGWLDEATGWFWAKKPRSRLLNQIRKILAVSPRVSLSELRAGVARHHRMQGFAPPKRVLAALCAAVGGYEVHGEYVVAVPPQNKAWGLGPLIARRGLEPGDFVMLTLDQRARRAWVAYGTEEPWVDQPGDSVPSAEAIDCTCSP